MIIFMKTARLFMILLIGVVILFFGCNNDDDPVTYTVTVTQDANGTAEADKTTAEDGTTVKLTATPNDGYIFEKWTVVSGDITLLPDATTNPATFTMPANAVNVKAEFAAIPPDTYAITVNNDGNGTAVADAETAEAGTIIELTATPNAGYVFSKWTVESGGITFEDETANPATFTMPANAISVKAEFVEQKGYSIYLAGYYVNAGYNYVYTLTNGVQTNLLPPTGGDDALPSFMTVSGDKTYVAGSYFDSDGWSRACYWVDGAVTKLNGLAGRGTDQTEYATSIAFSGGKVYVAGYYTNDYNPVPCYWVDGARTDLALPAGATFGGAYSIAVSGGKIYVAGYAYLSKKRVPGYWVDGTFVSLDIPAGANFQTNIGMKIVVADKVYVMGTYSLNSVYYPCVWLGDNRTELAFDASANKGAYGTSMAVADGKVYVAGYSITNDRNKACYWADGTRTDLDTPDNMYSDGWSIGVIDDKVYVGGRHYDSSYADKPCYWFDDERTDLNLPTGGIQASIKGMYISE